MIVKKKIAELLVEKISNLKKYSPTKFYKIIGPYICGIELIKVRYSQNFRPYFVIYPLYKKDIISCLEYPIYMFYFKGINGLELEFEENYDNDTILELIDIIYNKVSLLSKEAVTSSEMLNLILENEENAYPINKVNLFEIEFYISLFVDDKNYINNFKEYTDSNYINWDKNIFQALRGKYAVWLNGLQNKILDRDDFLKEININTNDPKINKFYKSSLIIS